MFGVRKVELKIQCRRHILRFTFTYFKEHDFDLNEELSGTRLGFELASLPEEYMERTVENSTLLNRITELEQENSYLKTLLQNAGIEYALSIVGGVSEAEPIFFWIRVSASYRKKSCGITRGSFTRTSGDA